jgi:hypothetical protein
MSAEDARARWAGYVSAGVAEPLEAVVGGAVAGVLAEADTAAGGFLLLVGRFPTARAARVGRLGLAFEGLDALVTSEIGLRPGAAIFVLGRRFTGRLLAAFATTFTGDCFLAAALRGLRVAAGGPDVSVLRGRPGPGRPGESGKNAFLRGRPGPRFAGWLNAPASTTRARSAMAASTSRARSRTKSATSVGTSGRVAIPESIHHPCTRLHL